MSWPWYTAAVLAAISLITAIMLLPLRIFVSTLETIISAMTLVLGFSARFKLPERFNETGRRKRRVDGKRALVELRKPGGNQAVSKKFTCSLYTGGPVWFGDAALDGGSGRPGLLWYAWGCPPLLPV